MRLRGFVDMMAMPWVAANGAKEFARAWIMGDRRAKREAVSCAHTCAACPSSVAGRLRVAGIVTLYCGRPFTPEDGERPTCGCLVGWVPRRTVEMIEKRVRLGLAPGAPIDKPLLERLVRAAIRPAGAAIVRSKACPQSQWVGLTMSAGHGQANGQARPETT